MTRQGSFKRAVRQRARATGERYTEARAALEQGKTAERRPRPFERAALAAHLEAHYGTRISSLALIDDEASRPRGSWEGATIRRRGAVARDGGSEEHDGGFYVGRPSQDLAAAMNTLASVEDALPSLRRDGSASSGSATRSSGPTAPRACPRRSPTATTTRGPPSARPAASSSSAGPGPAFRFAARNGLTPNLDEGWGKSLPERMDRLAAHVTASLRG